MEKVDTRELDFALARSIDAAAARSGLPAWELSFGGRDAALYLRRLAHVYVLRWADAALLSAYALWLVLSAPSWFPDEPSVLAVFLGEATLSGFRTPLLPYTYAMAVAAFLAGALAFRWHFPGVLRRVLAAGTLPFAAVELFEVPWQLLAWARYPPPWSGGLLGVWVLATAAFSAVGIAGVPYWRVGTAGLAVLASVPVLFAAWLAAGFGPGFPSPVSSAPVDAAFNVALKAACFLGVTLAATTRTGIGGPRIGAGGPLSAPRPGGRTGTGPGRTGRTHRSGPRRVSAAQSRAREWLTRPRPRIRLPPSLRRWAKVVTVHVRKARR